MNTPESSPSSSKSSPHSSRGTFWKRKRDTPNNPAKKLKFNPIIVSVNSLTPGYYQGKSLKVRMSMVPSEWDSSTLKVGRLLDDSGEVIVNAWRDGFQAISKLQFNCVYIISSFNVQPGYDNKDTVDVVLNSRTMIEEVTNVEEEFAPIVIKRSTMRDVIDGSEHATFDIVVVVSGIISTIEVPDAKTGRIKLRTKIYVTDESQEEIQLTLWDTTHMDSFFEGEGVIFRSVKKQTTMQMLDGEITAEVSLSVNEKTSQVWRNSGREEVDEVLKAVKSLKESMNDDDSDSDQ